MTKLVQCQLEVTQGQSGIETDNVSLSWSLVQGRSLKSCCSNFKNVSKPVTPSETYKCVIENITDIAGHAGDQN